MPSLQDMHYFSYAEICTISSDRSGMVASEGALIRAGSKKECVELCNFHFCCAFIFCQPMKKFEFLGASRAIRQRHFKTSSTGDENGIVTPYICITFKTNHSTHEGRFCRIIVLCCHIRWKVLL